MDSPTLIFAALDGMIQASLEAPSDEAVFPKQARWGYAAAALGALIGLLAVKLMPAPSVYAAVVAWIGLAIELAGLAVAAMSQIPKAWPTRANARRDVATQLDADLPHHLAIVAWLRAFPLDQRETLRDFASYRHDRMQEKLPLLVGSIEKLGALPVVVALYLQFKDLHWPPHPSWLDIFLIAVLVRGYWLGMRLIGIRLRLRLYGTLPGKALA